MGVPKILTLVLVATFLVAFDEVNGLKCYQCRNCTSVTSSQLITCGENTSSSSTSSSTSTSSTSTSSTSSSTSTSSTSSSSSSTSSTSSTSSSTTSSTDAPSTESSTSSTDAPSTESSTSSTDAPSTESSTSSTDAPSTESSTSSTDAPSTESSTSSSSTESSTSSSSTESSSSSSSTDESASSPDGFGSSSITEPTQVDALRVRRAAVENNDLCICQSENCSCRTGPSQYLSIVCITETVTVNNVKTVNRGCGVKYNATESYTCQISGYDTSCKTCEKDGCNAAYTFTLSLLLLVPAIFLSIKI